MTHHGSCHCGGIKFEVEGTIETLMDCNCSICRRRGHLLWFVPASAFRLLTPESEITTYRFNKKHIAHCFCRTCGSATHGHGAGPDGKEMYAVNARCLPDVDLKAFKIVEYDGAKL